MSKKGYGLCEWPGGCCCCFWCVGPSHLATTVDIFSIINCVACFVFMPASWIIWCALFEAPDKNEKDDGSGIQIMER